VAFPGSRDYGVFPIIGPFSRSNYRSFSLPGLKGVNAGADRFDLCFLTNKNGHSSKNKNFWHGIWLFIYELGYEEVNIVYPDVEGSIQIVSTGYKKSVFKPIFYFQKHHFQIPLISFN
jgi:hypothetical protein